MKKQFGLLKMAVLGTFLAAGACLSAQTGNYKLAEGSAVDPKGLQEQKSAPASVSEAPKVEISQSNADKEHPAPGDLIQEKEVDAAQVRPTESSTQAAKEAWVKDHPEDRALFPSTTQPIQPASSPAKDVKGPRGLNAVQLAAENVQKVAALDLLDMDPMDQERILKGDRKVEITRSNVTKDQVKGMPVTSKLFIEQHPNLFNIQ